MLAAAEEIGRICCGNDERHIYRSSSGLVTIDNSLRVE